ncbi:putative tetracycline-efflux transporter [Aspergillus fijiensis CBS 313.89]|uniref:MFS general substrate transporter n=1 Tax=Aspergillus fijiensis CBS 313.89 TaxID=1448319 RepID=A0A8G1RJ78_9EURO|nr:MFS general substrate transporter [Aspergillus fijiensis CBS 313.89]RAK74274.1 MFS general substrate transporter [Aspergillus fijiensis CBS 313.89]
MLGFGGTAVPKINLMVTLVCKDYMAKKASQNPGFTYLPVIIGSDNAQCQIPEVQSQVARFQLYYNLVAGILSALVCPRLGHLSDRHGRTRVIALSTLATVVGEAITLFVAAQPDLVSVNVLLGAAFVDGLGGSFTTIMALTASYASDCTLPAHRSVAFSYLYGALFSGLAAGPLLAAVLIKRTGQVLDVFTASLVLHILFLVTILLLVPESLSPGRQAAFRDRHRKHLHDQPPKPIWDTLNPKHLLTPLAVLLPPVGRPSPLFPNAGGATPALRRNIILLTTLDTLAFGVALGSAQVIIMYAEYKFGWGNVESSLFISSISIIRVLNLFVIYPIITAIIQPAQGPSTHHPAAQKKIPGSSPYEISLIRISILLDTLGNIGYALAFNGALMTFSGVILALGGMGVPTLQSSLTKHVPREGLGQILGAKGLLHALARIFAPTVCSLIYSVTVGRFTPAIFVVLAAVFGAASAASWWIRPFVGLDDESLRSSAPQYNEEGVHPNRGESEEPPESEAAEGVRLADEPVLP